MAPTGFRYIVRPKKASGSKLYITHEVMSEPSNQVGALGFGKEAHGNILWEAKENEPGNGKRWQTGDKWLKVEYNDGVMMTGWVPIIHQGVVVATLIDLVPEDSDEAGSVIPSNTMEVTVTLAVPGFASNTQVIRLTPGSN